MTQPEYYKAKTEPSDKELAILREPRVATVATVTPSGAPHVIPCWYVFDDAEVPRFYTTVASTSRRAKNIMKSGTARILVEHPMGWISAIGPAKVLVAGVDRSAEEVRALHGRVTHRYLTEEGRKHFLDASGVPDDAAIEITVERWMSWDMSQNFQSMAENRSPTGVRGWFVPVGKRDL